MTQTYVDSLKKDGKFDQEAQLKALTLAKDAILYELNDETKKFIETNYGNVEKHLTTLIEATIYTFKENEKKRPFSFLTTTGSFIVTTKRALFLITTVTFLLCSRRSRVNY